MVFLALPIINQIKDSSRYGQDTHTDFCKILSRLRQPNKNFSIFTTWGEMNSHQISRAQLKKWARHAHLKFQKVLAGNPNPMHLEPSNFVQSGFLQRFITGENLVLISLTISEIFKIENFSSLKCPQLGIKQFLKIVFIPS